jgi:hypothetical protein
VVWYLSGLTCTQANVTEKGEFRRLCAELWNGLIARMKLPDWKAHKLKSLTGFGAVSKKL